MARKQNKNLTGEKPESVSREDWVIAVMGPTGVGKSTFIEVATRQSTQISGHNLRSCTSEIQTFRVPHPTDGHPIVFVDTPGFDDTYKSDVEILGMIAKWLAQVYRGKITPKAILYLHRISDCRMSGSALTNFEVFQSMCGVDAVKSVVIVTTMWGQVESNQGKKREEELKTEYWRAMLDIGGRTMRFDGTHGSAWMIVDSVVNDAAVDGGADGRFTKSLVRSVSPDPSSTRDHPLRIQKEIVDEFLLLNETAAGRTLYNELKKLLEEQKFATQRLREQAGKQGNEPLIKQLNERKAELQQSIRHTTSQLNDLKIGFMQRLTSFLRVK